MPAIVESIEISWRPEDVFSYATDPSHFPQWQDNAVSAQRESGTALAVGSRAAVTRRVGPARLATTEVVTELSPPRTWTVRGVGAIPVAAIARGVIEPLDGGARCRVTIGFEFEAHGVGRLLLPLVIRPQVRKRLPRHARRLKEVLERGTGPARHSEGEAR